ncbi:homoserine dehydrogenase [Pelagibacterales bacterium]|jgi:homoserine dehydrogenase|nr:homoserine dehydrogenase [Pelagibacterales bacterium]|tara:strand:- start:337 stop:1593 length:1257 start_codon:yes stop_codon:yes gene_type:complete
MRNIGIAGFGTVGQGFFSQINKNFKNFKVIQIAVKNVKKKRKINLKNIKVTSKVQELAINPNIQVLVECIGGSSGAAYKLVKTAIENKKHIITANKALLAIHGNELVKLAEKNNVSISYEAAIAGGIPIVKTVRENLKYNNISKIYGILNGTCNYILTKMEKEGKDFSLVLKDAQKLGFAELDPTFDIKGIDAAHKITLLSSLAFNVPIKFSSTYIEGVDKVELDDFRFAREFGYKIKLLGIAERKKDSYEQRVHPCLVKEDSEIAKVENELNAVVVIDDMIGKTVLIGPGAGGKPTGAAIVADLIDLNRGNINLPLGNSISNSKKLKNINILDSSFAYYLKIVVKDEVGVMRRISDILARNKISIDQQKQEHSNKRGYATIVIITHKIKEKIFSKAIKEINNMKRINNKVKFIRTEG